MFNDTYDHIREIERLMKQIPNFRPRGHGVYIFSKFEYTAKDCDCRYCLHYRKGYGCTKDQCPYMKERITAGAVPLGEVLIETLSCVDNFAFQHRLMRYIKESEENPMNFKNEKHRAVFEEAVKRQNKKDYTLMSALYLLTADGRLWNQISRYVSKGEIAFDRIRLNGTTESGYTLFCCAKDLALGTKHITVSDLADSELISPKLFAVICNAMAIRRYGLGAIQFDGKAVTV